MTKRPDSNSLTTLVVDAARPIGVPMDMAALPECSASVSNCKRVAAWMLFTLACAFLALIARVGEVTHDAFHEMALFRELLTHGRMPIVDVFAYTPTVNPSVHHEWGTGAILYWATVGTGLGLTGLTILKGLLTCALGCVLYRVARLRGVHPVLFALLTITVFPFLWVGFATVRATLFTLLCLSIQLWMQERDRRGHRLWTLAWWCMIVLWLNLHAGFLVGIGLMGIYAVQRFATLALESRSLSTGLRATWHLPAILCSTLLALPINPYGWQYVTYLISAIAMPRPRIAEWLPLWHTYDPALTLSAFAVSIALCAIGVRRQSWSQRLGLAGLIVCGVLALQHLRHGPLYAVLWIAYVPAWITYSDIGRDLIKRVNQHPAWSIRTCQLVAVGLLCWSGGFGFGKTTLTADPRKTAACYPVDAIEYLTRQNFAGNLMTPFHAGAYVSWTMHPQVKVSLDGRYEVAYAPEVFDEHWDFFEARDDWPAFLDKYRHDALLVPQSSPIRPLLEVFREPQGAHLPTRDAWQFVHEDDAYAVLTRASQPPTTDDSRVY